jgi:hypothetical protein
LAALYFSMRDERKKTAEGEITITDLFPDLSPAEQAEAEYHMLQYFELTKRIFDRIAKENPEILTVLEERVMLRKRKANTPE